MNNSDAVKTLTDDAGMFRGYAIKADAITFGTVSATRPAQTILPMIEQRIREQVEPQAKVAMEHFRQVVLGEMEAMGINKHRTKVFDLIDQVSSQYTEKLVFERINALVDSLVPPAQDATA